MRSITLGLAALVLVSLSTSTAAFCPSLPTTKVSWTTAASSPKYTTRVRPMVSKEIVDDNITWVNDDDDDDDDEEDYDLFLEDEDQEEDEEDDTSDVHRLRSSKWHQLHPKIKERIIKEGQERAIANKKKNESSQTKKRRVMMFVKKEQQKKKRASRVKRPTPLDQRTPLSELTPGMELTGTVISLVNFGAYIDVGTECDGLLHISQISRDVFVEHPKQVLTPGDEVTVRVRAASPELKKLQVTMLPMELVELEREKREELEDRIPLEDIQIDDELWGEIVRVTDYGAYVEVGAITDGFLHFMDHPLWVDHHGSHPSEFMSVGDRIRSWVSDIDSERQRIKLTANRPNHLPGPRREFR